MDSSKQNRFDLKFKELSEDQENLEHIRRHLSEGLSTLNEFKRTTSSKQASLTILEFKLKELRSNNQRLKDSLVEALIDRDEALAQKQGLAGYVEQLRQQLDTLDKDSNHIFNDDLVDQVCERFSPANQLSTLTKIQEARCKLTKYQK